MPIPAHFICPLATEKSPMNFPVIYKDKNYERKNIIKKLIADKHPDHVDLLQPNHDLDAEILIWKQETRTQYYTRRIEKSLDYSLSSEELYVVTEDLARDLFNFESDRIDFLKLKKLIELYRPFFENIGDYSYHIEVDNQSLSLKGQLRDFFRNVLERVFLILMRTSGTAHKIRVDLPKSLRFHVHEHYLRFFNHIKDVKTFYSIIQQFEVFEPEFVAELLLAFSKGTPFLPMWQALGFVERKIIISIVSGDLLLPQSEISAYLWGVNHHFDKMKGKTLCKCSTYTEFMNFVYENFEIFSQNMELINSGRYSNIAHQIKKLIDDSHLLGWKQLHNDTHEILYKIEDMALKYLIVDITHYFNKHSQFWSAFNEIPITEKYNYTDSFFLATPIQNSLFEGYIPKLLVCLINADPATRKNIYSAMPIIVKNIIHMMLFEKLGTDVVFNSRVMDFMFEIGIQQFRRLYTEIRKNNSTNYHKTVAPCCNDKQSLEIILDRQTLMINVRYKGLASTGNNSFLSLQGFANLYQFNYKKHLQGTSHEELVRLSKQYHSAFLELVNEVSLAWFNQKFPLLAIKPELLANYSTNMDRHLSTLWCAQQIHDYLNTPNIGFSKKDTKERITIVDAADNPTLLNKVKKFANRVQLPIMNWILNHSDLSSGITHLEQIRELLSSKMNYTHSTENGMNENGLQELIATINAIDPILLDNLAIQQKNWINQFAQKQLMTPLSYSQVALPPLTNNIIPPRFVYIWVGSSDHQPNPLPLKYVRNIIRLKRKLQNNNAEFIVYTNQNDLFRHALNANLSIQNQIKVEPITSLKNTLDTFTHLSQIVRAHLWHNLMLELIGLHNFAAMSDGLRLLALYPLGGAYIDTDIIFTKKFKHLPQNDIGFGKADANNCMLLASPMHPFIFAAINALAENLQKEMLARAVDYNVEPFTSDFSKRNQLGSMNAKQARRAWKDVVTSTRTETDTPTNRRRLTILTTGPRLFDDALNLHTTLESKNVTHRSVDQFLKDPCENPKKLSTKSSYEDPVSLYSEVGGALELCDHTWLVDDAQKSHRTRSKKEDGEVSDKKPSFMM